MNFANDLAVMGLSQVNLLPLEVKGYLSYFCNYLVQNVESSALFDLNEVLRAVLST